MAKLGSMENFGLSPKQLEKIQKDAAEASKGNLEQKDFFQRQKEELAKQKQAERLMKDSATYSDHDKRSLREGKHKHGTRISAGYDLPTGKRGGRKYGEYRAA